MRISRGDAQQRLAFGGVTKRQGRWSKRDFLTSRARDRDRRCVDELAEWWDDAIGDGNATQDLLVEPVQERLLELNEGETVLDIACGAGRFTRRMAGKGVQIVAFDHSERFIARAKERTGPELAERVEYHVLSADDSDALLALGERRFDAAVGTMALMDMARIKPLLSVLPRLLAVEGRFVFSVTHPVFNSGDARLVAELVRSDRTFVTELSIKITDYLTPRMQRDVGIRGQPSSSSTSTGRSACS